MPAPHPAADARWHLELSGEVVARIADAGERDFPWTYGTLLDSPGFERFRASFTDPDDWTDDDAVIDALCEEVQNRGGFVLRDLRTGQGYRAVTLNQHGASVWFRVGKQGRP